MDMDVVILQNKDYTVTATETATEAAQKQQQKQHRNGTEAATEAATATETGIQIAAKIATETATAQGSNSIALLLLPPWLLSSLLLTIPSLLSFLYPRCYHHHCYHYCTLVVIATFAIVDIVANFSLCEWVHLIRLIRLTV